MLERKPVPELLISDWQFTEVRVPSIGGEMAYVRVDAVYKRGDGPWFHVAWPQHDDNEFTRSTALASLMFAVARYIANPGAYYKAQYERMMQDKNDGSAA